MYKLEKRHLQFKVVCALGRLTISIMLYKEYCLKSVKLTSVSEIKGTVVKKNSRKKKHN